MKHLDLITIIIGALTLILGIAGIIISLILRSEYMIVSICGCIVRRFCLIQRYYGKKETIIYANMLHHLHFCE